MASAWPFLCSVRGGFNPALPVYMVGYGSDMHSNTGGGTRKLTKS